MNYITDRKATLKSRLTILGNQLTNLYTQYDNLSKTENESYSFDSGEGSQRATRRKLSEVSSEIEKMEKKYDEVFNQLFDMGLVNISLRRTRPGGVW